MFFSTHRRLVFYLVLIVMIGGGVFRSAIATSLDGFTLDEGYHIGAGVAYVHTGDFRLNPEHPPLVKLWAGAFISAFGYQLSPYRQLNDKNDERGFVEDDIYLNNDPDVIQSRARIAMLVFNALLLLVFAVAARQVFGELIAVAATAFLVIDPTVAANLPVVMTDLPVALLSITAVLFAIRAFTTWRAADLVFAALTLGLALGTKHSAVITLAAVAVLGGSVALFREKDIAATLRLKRIGLVFAVLVGAIVVLWSFYLFRFNESPGVAEEQFNRPLADKISDINSPWYRSGLKLMAGAHLFPRSYVWGMADTIRAGAEGRARRVYAFGREYDKAPFYFFPGVIAVKLPLGLLFLTLLGAALLILRRVPGEFRVPLYAVIGFALLFLTVLATGSSYAGIRHALPVVPALALLASLVVLDVARSRSYWLGGVATASLLWALFSALPVMRPWEFYNETAGGPINAYRYFSDEGIDISLRTKDLIKYFNENLRSSRELPFIFYPVRRSERKARDLDWVGNKPERDATRIDDPNLSGTILIGARQVRSKAAYRDAVPFARFGNLFIFKGTFYDPDSKVMRLAVNATNKIYTAEPDTEGAIKLLVQAVALDPTKYTNALELGNQYLKLGQREQAIEAYQIAKDNVVSPKEINELLGRQIERLSAEPLEQITPLRNPKIE